MYPLFGIFFIQTLQQKQGTLWHCVNIQMFSLSPNGMDEIHVLQCFGFFYLTGAKGYPHTCK